jgi:intracellular multiplication protein IcmO
MQRGIDKRQEVDPSLLIRDTRTIGQKVADFFREPIGVALMLVVGVVPVIAYPAFADVFLLFAVVSFAYTSTRKLKLPFRMPQSAHTLDYNDLKPGGTKPNKSRGITFFGNEKKTLLELWFNNEDMRTHVLIFGSTGSGKTEALVSISYNALLQGSGFIYVDGKGDNSLYAKIFSMVRSMGREDDLLLINFMTGARDIVGPQEKRLSNTLNPFATGSSSMLSQLVVSLMDSASESSDGDMWKGRAISFVEALMKVLVYMRDLDLILLDANSVRNYFHLNKLEIIAFDRMFPRDGQDSVSIESAPEVVIEPIKNYLLTLPGFTKDKKGKQVSQVYEQHGFITMQLTRVFTSLADTYGHIIRHKLAEVDFKDVVLNRRILVVLLPALEKSPDELANLGKIIIASLRAMMAAGLGEEVEGEYQDIVMRKPTNAPTPYLCILDEYGYYAVKGFAVVPAQARSLGFSTIFAGQDLPAFQKASKEEAASIGANTNIKICMKLEDPVDTWDFFTKTAGEAYVTKVDSFQTKENNVTNSYQDTKSASFEKRARIDLMDLKDQAPGEAHIFFRSDIVRVRMFFADPKPAKEVRINHFVKVEPPPDSVLIALTERLNKFGRLLEAPAIFEGVNSDNEDINFIVNAIAENDFLDPIERSVSVLIAFHNREEPEFAEAEAELYVELPDNEINIFTPLRISGLSKAKILTHDVDKFSEALLNKAPLQSGIGTIERVAGKLDKHAVSIAQEIVKDIQIATHYPPDVRDHIDGPELASLVERVITKIKVARVKAESNRDTVD